MSETVPERPHVLQGGGDKPRWAPKWAPTAATLDYLQKLALILMIALGALYFLGVDRLRPFAIKHVAAV